MMTPTTGSRTEAELCAALTGCEREIAARHLEIAAIRATLHAMRGDGAQTADAAVTAVSDERDARLAQTDTRLTAGEACEAARSATRGGAMSVDVRFQHCRSCQALVYWARTAAGTPCPFDVRDGEPTTDSHFKTCPEASAGSRKRAAS